MADADADLEGRGGSGAGAAAATGLDDMSHDGGVGGRDLQQDQEQEQGRDYRGIGSNELGDFDGRCLVQQHFPL